MRDARIGHAAAAGATEQDRPAPFLRCLLAALAAAVAVPALAADPLPVAPPPREVRPDGSRDPAPEGGKAEDPVEVVNRIIANAKRVSDKLAMTDAGEATRATQGGILKDIDKLLDPPDSPPKGGGGESNDKNNQDKNDQNKSGDKGNDSKEQKGDGKDGGMPGMKEGGGGKGGPDPKGGMNPGGMNPGGMNPIDGQTNGRRPRQGGLPKDGKEPSSTASTPKGGEKGPMPMPMDPGGTVAKTGDPKDQPGTTAGGNKRSTDRLPPLSPQLPLADEVAKEVWGHLPERLRQQMSQYYREEFMPRYAGLLRQYYSSLANSPGGAAPPAPPMPR